MHRVLPAEPFRSLTEYTRAGGGAGLRAARELGPDGVVEHVMAAGLRGRGGAGFPTGTKWQTVRSYASSIPPTVVVNGAEGEPGSFKDRAIVRANPYAVVEGALIAAIAVGADGVVIAVKEAFTDELRSLRRAVAEVDGESWADGVDVSVFAGPSEYLFGEETGLLEVIDGRPPFPRVTPPFRDGVEEVEGAPPTLVNNVETIAHVPGILAHGPAWFREVGTDESPGTLVCTVSGATRRAGVAEVAMGTPLRRLLDEVGGGAKAGRSIVGAMSGVANPVLTEDQLDTPLSHEGMLAAGSGLGAAGFIVFDDATDFAAVAQAVADFLAVESCGQCTPCKQDGLALSALLDDVRRSDANELDLVAVDDHLRTVADGARCSLAQQHQRVIGSIVERFGEQLRAHVEGKLEFAPATLVAPIVDIVSGVLVLDERQAEKQPDWSFDPVDSGKTPVDRWRDESGPEGPDDLAIPVAATGGEPAPSAVEARDAPDVDGIPVEDLDPHDPEAALYTSEPLETEHGTVVIQQQNVGPDNEAGGGEWPDPDTPPADPAPGGS
jgi:NADH:ubiquinone oxidoreductase subunit F (NADH-binding)